MSVYEFGRELLRTNDLDPVYVVLHEAGLRGVLLQRWLLAYWTFYHVGTASWIAEGDYWTRMRTAAGSKEYPRCHERRHFRGENARKSVEYLASRGIDSLFAPLIGAVCDAEYILAVVQQWVGFGPWISFKVADMLDRLGLAVVKFDVDTAMYKGSPTEGAALLWETEGKPLSQDGKPILQDSPSSWAVGRVLSVLGEELAPPRYERPINVQEVETILCKWKSYMGGHYRIGEDIEATRTGLLRFPRCRLSQRLLAGGRSGGLW